MEGEAPLYKLLGELSADMKHVLRSLDANRTDTATLRAEMHNETSEMRERLTRVEKFNVRVLAYASVLVPILMVFLNWGLPMLLNLI